MDNDGSLDVSSVTKVTEPTNGTATVDPVSGLISYTHAGSVTTNDSFTYTVKDNEGAVSNVATVTITINEVVIPNVAPVAVDDTVSPIDIAGVITVDVLTNDDDSDGTLNPATVTIVDVPINGSTAIDLTNGNITYTHDGTETTNDSFAYTVEDNEGAASNAARVHITINEVVIPNVMPVATDDTASPIDIAGVITIDVLSNDSDSDGTINPTTVTIVDEPSNGSTEINLTNGKITYTHDGTGTTSDSFTYTVKDNEDGVSNTATVSISINEVIIPNVAPVAQDDTPSPADIGGTISIDVLANDSDSDGTLNSDTVTLVDAPSNGTTAIDASTGRVTYTHDGSATSVDSFSYTVEDNEGVVSNTATVNITILDINKLLANDDVTYSGFGYSVSIAGDTAVIGAKDDSDNGSQSGSAYVFIRDGSGNWSQQAKLTANDGAAGDLFGISVSIDGDTAIIGAIDDDNGNQSGSAYVFVRDGSGNWSQQAKLTEDDGTAFTWFGISVSIAGDTAVIGAFQDDDNGNQSGSAYVFVRDGSGNWSQQAKLIADDGAAGDRFGISVSIARDTVVIGAPGRNPGSAYVFVRDDSGNWSQQEKLTAKDGNTNDQFGRSVSIAGDTAVIGAIFDDDNGIFSGSAYVFVRDGSGNWSQQSKLTANDGAANDSFSISVSIAGDTAVIGAFSDRLDFSEQASAYVFDLNSLTPNSEPIAGNDTAEPIENAGSIDINVLTNDIDSDGSLNISSVTIVTEPSNGTATVDPTSGLISYTHDGSATTSDSFTYTVEDNEGAVSNIATVNITINEIVIPNVAPVAADDTASPIDIGGEITIDVLDNDADSDGSLVSSTVTIVNVPVNGSTAIDPSNGHITYTHDGTETTSDSFTYTVNDNEGTVSNVATVSITINSPPASCGKSIELDGINDLINIPDLVLRSDFTLEGWVKLAPGIDHKDGLLGDGVYTHLNFVAGKARLNAYGVRITANTAIAADTWSHIAVTRSGSNLTMYVNGVKDATGIYRGSLSIKFLGKGYRGFFKGMMDEVRIWNVGRSAAEINDSYNTAVDPSVPGLIGYWNFNGTDQMITDVSSSSNHGSLGINTDSGTDDPVRMDLIDPVNQNCGGSHTNVAPLASDDTIGPIETGATISFSVTGNDTDSDGNLNPASVEIVSGPNDGTASVDASGVITYENTGTTATTDTLSYTVADTEGAISNIATVSITISDPAINEVPVAQADTAIVQTGGSVLITVLSNDSDNDGSLNTNSLTIINQSSYGTIDIDDAGEITYTHDGLAMMSDSFTYTVEDDEGAVSNIATVSITISSLTASCGKSIELDGNNDLINIPDLVLRGDFTLEGWVKLAAGIDHKDGLLGDGVYTHLNFASGKPRLNAYGVRITANTAISADTWSHIAVTRSGSDLTMYANGVEDATGIYRGSLAIKYLGKGYRGFFKGMMDEVRIWDVARSGAEINTSFDENVAPDAQGLIGYWSFDGSDQTVIDTSNFANHGSLGANTSVNTDDPMYQHSTAPLSEDCAES